MALENFFWATPLGLPEKHPSVESSFLLRQRSTPRQSPKDNRPIFLLLFLTFLHAKDIWRNIHVFQHGKHPFSRKLLRIPRTAPFVLVFCFAGNVQSRSAAGKPITMRENLFVSLLILVCIVVGFSTHILSTDQTCLLRMITGFLSGG